jgi:tetratricopeptide (TPR) repeat protein
MPSNLTKAGRNDPCLCGSGKKSKKCCGQGEQRGADAQPDALQSILAQFHAGDFTGMQRSAELWIERQPDSGMAWKAYGLALRKQGKVAWDALRKACRLMPADAEVWLNLGNAQRDHGQLTEALASYERALKLKPDFAEAYCNLGLTQRDLGLFALAIANCRKALKLRPDFAYAHLNLGLALRDIGKLDDAMASCRSALRLQPGVAEVHNNIGNIWQDLDQFDNAAASYRQAISIRPNYADSYVNLAKVQKKMGRLADAADSCLCALQMEPDLVSALIFLANIEADQGRFLQAQSVLERAVSIKPDSVEAWSAMPYLRKMTHSDRAWLDNAELLLSRRLPAREEVLLRFAMGKFFDDLGKFECAFDHYQRANELGKTYAVDYDRDKQRQAFELLARTYDRTWISRIQESASRSARPVFIVGMPRSGTSLAEQILAAHPAVFGAGELSFWSAASNVLLSSAQHGPLDAAKVHACAEAYLRQLDGFSATADRIVDKMPGNFMFLGLIHAVFPNARIIHMQRDPVDTCLSIYFQRFEIAHSYANDLENLVQSYEEYRHAMAHWRAVLPPGTILDVPYEALVDDQAGWTRAMLEFIGLPWDERCLEFHSNSRIVSTASNWQVRQKINKSSVARWRNYEPFIGSLLKLHEADAEHDHASAEAGGLGVLLALKAGDVALDSIHHGFRQVDKKAAEATY